MTIDEALNSGYEFEFGGERYAVHGVTMSVKGSLAAWLKTRMLDEGRKCLPPDEYAQFRREVIAGNAVSDPATLLAALSSLEGTAFLLRKCLKGEDGKPAKVSDETLLDMLQTEHVRTIFDLLAAEMRDPKAARSLLLGK